MGHGFEHFKTITHHRHLVMKNCFKVGLYKQGLMHDLSKYSPVEFSVGAKYYQGTRSPNNAEREATGLSFAWLHPNRYQVLPIFWYRFFYSQEVHF